MADNSYRVRWSGGSASRSLRRKNYSPLSLLTRLKRTMIMHAKAAAWLDGIFDEASWYMHKDLKKFMGLFGY